MRAKGVLLLVCLALLQWATRCSAVEVVPILPFGDSITSCCHACSVQEALLPPDLKKYAEPVQPFEGYLRPLWKLLSRQAAASTAPAVRYEYVGRMTDCIFPKKNMTRATTRDWPVRYEAYYGYATKRFLREGIPTKAMQHAVITAEVVPRVTLFHVGTNDLIAPRSRNKVGGAVANIELIIENLAFGSPATATQLAWDDPLLTEPSNSQHAKALEAALQSPLAEASADERATTCALVKNAGAVRRALTVCLPIPIHFALVTAGSVGLSYSQRARRWHRNVALNIGYTQLFNRLTTRRKTKASSVAKSPATAQPADRTNPESPAFAAPVVRPLLVRASRLKALRESCDCQDRNPSSPASCWSRRALPRNDSAPGEWVDSGVDLALVDMYTGFSPKDDLHGDGLHPNVKGEAIIAQRYYDAIQAALQHWRGGFPQTVEVQTSHADAEPEPVDTVPKPVPSATLIDSVSVYDGYAVPLLVLCVTVFFVARQWRNRRAK